MAGFRTSASFLVVLLTTTLVGTAAPARATTPRASGPTVAEAAQITITGFNQSEGSAPVTVEISGTATCFDPAGTASITASALQWEPELHFAIGTTTILCADSPVAWSVTSTTYAPGFYPWGIHLQARLTDDDGQRSVDTSWWYPYV